MAELNRNKPKISWMAAVIVAKVKTPIGRRKSLRGRTDDEIKCCRLLSLATVNSSVRTWNMILKSVHNEHGIGMQLYACQAKRETNIPTHCRATDNSKYYCNVITITVLPNAGLSRIGIQRTKIKSPPPLTRLPLPHRSYNSCSYNIYI